MAITDSQKIDYIWKKVGYGATKTDTNSNKLAPNEAIPSPLLVRGDRVWNQSSSIPSVKPSSTSGVVTLYTGATTVECTEDNTATQNRTWKTGLTDWIPPQFGSTYIVNIYIHTSGDASGSNSISNKVFVTGSGNNDEWFFDYESGVLNFIGTNLPNGKSFSGNSVYVEGARYTGTFGVGSSGGSSLGNITAENTTLTTPTNDDLILDPQGTGIVVINSTSSMKLPYGTTAERPTSPDEGEIRYNSTLDQVEVYKNSAWERVGDPDSATLTNDTFDGDDTTTGFTLSNTASTNTVIVTLNGVVQVPTTDYTVSGTTLTFTTAPATGDKISVKIFSSITYLDRIQDADGDTKIQVEESADEDVIRFDTAGSERLSINASGLTVTGTLNTHTIPSGTGTLALKKTPQIGTFTTSQDTTSSSYVDVTGYTTSITTTEANSKLKVNLVITRSGDAGKIKLVRTVGATDTDIIEIPFLSGDGNLTSSYIDSLSESSGTTVTYKIQHTTNGSGTVYVNYGTTNNQISIEEL